MRSLYDALPTLDKDKDASKPNDNNNNDNNDTILDSSQEPQTVQTQSPPTAHANAELKSKSIEPDSATATAAAAAGANPDAESESVSRHVKKRHDGDNDAKENVGIVDAAADESMIENAMPAELKKAGEIEEKDVMDVEIDDSKNEDPTTTTSTSTSTSAIPAPVPNPSEPIPASSTQAQQQQQPAPTMSESPFLASTAPVPTSDEKKDISRTSSMKRRLSSPTIEAQDPKRSSADDVRDTSSGPSLEGAIPTAAVEPEPESDSLEKITSAPIEMPDRSLSIAHAHAHVGEYAPETRTTQEDIAAEIEDLEDGQGLESELAREDELDVPEPVMIEHDDEGQEVVAGTAAAAGDEGEETIRDEGVEEFEDRETDSTLGDDTTS